MTCPRSCVWKLQSQGSTQSIWLQNLCSWPPLSPSTHPYLSTLAIYFIPPSILHSPIHPALNSDPMLGMGDTQNVYQGWLGWEGDILLPEQELPMTTPSGAEDSGRTGFQLTALENSGGSSQGKLVGPWQLRGGHVLSEGLRDPGRHWQPHMHTPTPCPILQLEP